MPDGATTRHARGVYVFGKYLLFQLPGWTLVAIVLALAVRFFELPVWLAWAVWGANVAKDLVLYRWLRAAYADHPSRFVGGDALVGAEGHVEEALTPQGFVRVRGERWKALARGGTELDAGRPIRVVSVRGLVLTVEPLAPSEGASVR